MKPQDVTNKPGENAIFMLFALTANEDASSKVKELCSNFAAIVRSMKNRFPEAEVSAVIGFGANAWTTLFPDFPRPKELAVFEEIKGKKHTAVSTAGSVTVLMGSSGCGKTTLLNLILGLLKPDEGSILFSPSGACAASESPAALSSEVTAAAVYQEDRLIESLTAAANIQLACPRRARAEVLEALDALGLAADADTSVSTLSGGMRRRVALARALLFPSALLALDEAFDGLDSVTRDRAIDYAKTQLRGRTVVMVTHTAEEAVRMGGAVVQL